MQWPEELNGFFESECMNAFPLLLDDAIHELFAHANYRIVKNWVCRKTT